MHIKKLLFPNLYLQHLLAIYSINVNYLGTLKIIGSNVLVTPKQITSKKSLITEIKVSQNEILKSISKRKKLKDFDDRLLIIWIIITSSIMIIEIWMKSNLK